MHAALALRLILLALLHQSTKASKVTYLVNAEGSLGGDTHLEIHGDGFSEDPFSFGEDNELKGNVVYLESPTQSYKCKTVKLWCNTKKITVITPAVAAEGFYTILVYVDGVAIEDYFSGCGFTYALSNTPTVETVTPNSGPPGTIITVCGYIITDKLESSSNSESESTSEADIFLRTYLGGVFCHVTDENNDLYGVQMDSDTSKNGCFKCAPLPLELKIGSGKATYIISDSYGNSRSEPGSLTVSVKNEIYHFQAHSAITSINPNLGSTAGGNTLTITGEYFDENLENTVAVGGSTCEVTNVTITEIQCTMPAIPSQRAPYPGNRGLIHEIWTENSPKDSNSDDLRVANFDVSASDYEWKVGDSSYSASDVGDNYMSRERGFFKVPFNSTYKFVLKCDDSCVLYFSKDGDSDTKEEIASCPYYTTNWDTYPEQISEAMYLIAGSYHYFEALHREGTGGDHLKVGVIYDDSPFTSSDLNTDESGAIDEFQVITTNSTVLWEKQSIDISTWSGKFVIEYGGLQSAQLDLSSTESQMKEELINMFSMKCSFTSDPGGSYFSNRFDTDEELLSGEIVYSILPYCGLAAAKNVKTIFLAENEASRINIKKRATVCFAYTKGIGSWFATEYYNSDGSEFYTKYYTFEPQSSSTTDWIFTCVDLEESDSFMYLSKLYFVAEEEGVDYYMDEIFVAPSSFVVNQQGGAIRPNAISIKEVNVEKGSDGVFTINMLPANCGEGNSLPAIGFLNSDGTTSKAASQDQKASPPITGTFDITFNSKTITVAADILAENLENRFDGDFGVSVSINREGDCTGYEWNIVWTGTGGNQPELQVDGNGLSGNNVMVMAQTNTNGGMLLAPIYSDWFRTVHDNPQVTVDVNGIPSSCPVFGNCKYTFDWNLTAIIESINPVTGPVGTQVTLAGHGFSSITSDNLVKIGDSECQIISSSENEIVCTVSDDSEGGSQPVVMELDGFGNAEYLDGEVIYFTVSVEVTSVTPSSGSFGGGTEIVISGNGFSTLQEQVEVDIDGITCNVIDSSPTSITCITSATDGGSRKKRSLPNIFASINVVTLSQTGSLNNGFQLTNIGSITNIAANFGSLSSGSCSAGEFELTITGSDFGDEKAANDPVSLVNTVTSEKTICKESSYASQEIVCTSPPLAPGEYQVSLNLGVGGDAHFDTSNLVCTLEVTGITPQLGSRNGGTVVTISGSGFGTDTSNTSVIFTDRNIDCSVISTTENEISCITSNSGATYYVDNGGIHEEFGLGYKWDPRSLEILIGDTVTWQWASPALGNEIGYRVYQVPSEDSNTYDGLGFFSGETKSTIGSYSYKFESMGTYYYSSGGVNADNSFWMNGIITVKEPESIETFLSVSINGFSATQDTNSNTASSPSSGNCPGGTTSLVDSSCIDTTPTDSQSAFAFVFDKCFTSLVTNISNDDGDREDISGKTINILGDGFSTTDCENEVKVGSVECMVDSSAANQIKCKISDNSGLTPGVNNEVTVNVKNRGYASLPQNPVDRTFTLLPRIDSINPEEGSTAGGTLLTISGDGFGEEAEEVVLLVDNVPCTIVSVVYNSIQCRTGAREDNIGTTLNNLLVTAHGSRGVCDEGDCLFLYKSSLTPIVNSISTSRQNQNIYGSSTVTFNITNLNNDVDSNNLTISIGGEHSCTVESVSGDSVVCTINEVPVGTHEVIVDVADIGYASGGDLVNMELNSLAIFNSVSPASGSINGGTILNITGSGFIEGDTQVTLDGKECQISEVTISNVICTSPSHASGTVEVKITTNNMNYETEVGSEFLDYEYSNSQTPVVTGVSPTSGNSGDELTITGTGLDDGSGVKVTIDGEGCVVTASNATSITCTVPNHSAGLFDVVINVGGKGLATSSATFEYVLNFDSSMPSTGSYGGGLNMTISGSGFDSENSVVTICSVLTCEIISASSTEIVCEVPANDDFVASIGDTACDVKVSVGGLEKTKSAHFTYDESLTPVITQISPTRGGTGGGTTVTITGSDFSASGNTVTIDGTECDITTESTNEIVCKTGAHSPSEKANIKVEPSGGNGVAFSDDDNALYYYVDVWSSQYTWGGDDPPIEGDFVIVPTGQTLLIDVNTPILKMLLIQGGEVIFDEADVELKAENILITNQGLLQVGTEDEPFEHKGIITMYGHTRSQEMPLFGAKTLAVRNGTLDLHGKKVPVTWTRLAQTANKGDTQIVLEREVTWEVGDEMVIATTGDRFSQDESERVTITAVSADTVSFTPALAYEHISHSEEIGGITLETRAEVGLLTRNVVVRGNVNDDWTEEIEACEEEFDTDQFATQSCFQGRFGAETASDQFGSQIMLFAKEKDKHWVIGRIEYVEIYHAGQAFRLGKYPIHFHVSGNISTSYVRGCGIHNTFNRAVTIHEVNYLLVEYNVAYYVMGHAYFLEDGIEIHNIIQYNLGIKVLPSSSLLNVDITPATFWIINPDNIIRHNAAAGGSHFGYWYNMPVHPGGPSFTEDVCPRNVPVLEFHNNTAHSFGRYGLWIWPDYTPKVGGGCDSNEETPAKFHSLTAWNCERGAEVSLGGTVQFIDFVMANNDFAGIEVTAVSGPWGDEGPLIKDAVIIGHSEISTNASAQCSVAGIRTPHTDKLTVDGACFVNFDQDRCTTLQACSHCKNNDGAWPTRFKNICYKNAPNRGKFQWQHECWYEDLDGSLLEGAAGRLVTPTNPNLPSDHCSVEDAYGFGSVTGSICDSTIKLHRLGFNKPDPSSLKYKDALFTNTEGTSSIPYKKKRLTHPKGWTLTVIEGHTYNWIFENADQITNISYSATFYEFDDGDHVLMYHNFTQKPDVFSTTGEISNGSNALVTYNDNENGDFHFDTSSKKFTYIVSGKDEEDAVERQIELEVYQCYFLRCIPPVPQPVPDGRPDEFFLWSDLETWESVAQDRRRRDVEDIDFTNSVPVEGDNVMILPGMYVIMDVDPPKLGKLFIYGTLEIDDEMNHILEADLIFMQGVVDDTGVIPVNPGRFIVGWNETHTYQHEFTIKLCGNHYSEELLTPGGPVVGAKAIGVFGYLQMHGKPHNVYWTQLATTANTGDTSIVLKESVTDDWEVTNEIVIATTDFEAWHTETFKIVSISADGKTLTLNGSLQYNHIVATYTIGDYTFSEAAEVGLLTRNIKIEGADYDDLFEESFGARMIVSTFEDAGDGTEYKGFARLSNVEFFHTGQEGWKDFYDPRYSVAFLDIGDVDEIRPSYVKGCSFHNGFNTAIGVFGTNGMTISDNVIHHTVGAGVILWEKNQVLVRNLVTLMIFAGTYQDRVEPENLDWPGGIEVNMATNVVMMNNTVAGSERVGFRIAGEDDDETVSGQMWSGNTAHGTLFGLHIFHDKVAPNTRISEFTVYNAYFFGIEAELNANLLIENMVMADNFVGIHIHNVGPSALSHTTSDKKITITKSLIIGESDSFDCTVYTEKPEIQQHSTKWQPPSGKVALKMPSFMSGSSGAPFFPFDGCMSYPSIYGLTVIKDVTFSDFGESKCADTIVIFQTNRKNGDSMFPVHVSGITLHNVGNDQKVKYGIPQIGQVNPSDCVDMDCDAMKKVLIKDLDGSFLGSANAHIIPDSAFEWDGDPSRGLGDYRIPKMMLTEPGTGARLNINNVAPNKGIAGVDDCTWNENWNAYLCVDLDYEMLIVESMDADTETRRLSPVALLYNRGASGYVDLVNGPMDHGWCLGYTCQERISTFYTMVATNSEYEIYFTSVNPQDLRLHLLYVDENDKVLVGIWYATPQRLDVYRKGLYIAPTNVELTGTKFEYTANGYRPSLSDGDAIPAQNYYEKDLQTLWILIIGPEPVVIKTTTVIIVAFGVDPVSIDDFYEVNLVSNLKNLLGLDESQIRIVNAVSESRRRRATTETIVTVEIGDPPLPSIDTPSSESTYNSTESTPTEAPSNYTGNGANLTASDLNSMGSSIIELLQTNELDEVLNLTITSLEVTEAEDPPVDPTDGVRATNETEQEDSGLTYEEREEEEEDSGSSLVYTIPVELELYLQPEGTYEDAIFFTQPAIHTLDSDGNHVENLGSSLSSWVVEVSLRAVSGSGEMMGNGTLVFINGWANASDLGVTDIGDYILDITVVKPASSSLADISSDQFTVDMRPLHLHIISQPSETELNQVFSPSPVLEIRDNITGEAWDITWRDHTWQATLTLFMESIYLGELKGGSPQTINDSSMEFDGLYIDHAGVQHVLQISVTSDPDDYSLSVLLNPFDVVDPDAEPLDGDTISAVKWIYDSDYDTAVGGRETYFKIHFRNHMGDRYLNVTIGESIELESGSVLVSFEITGMSDAVTSTLLDMYSDVQSGMSLTFDGVTMVLQPVMYVDGEEYFGAPIETKDSSFPMVGIIGIVVGVTVLAIIIAVIFYCYNKKQSQKGWVKDVDQFKKNYIYHSRPTTAVNTESGKNVVMVEDFPEQDEIPSPLSDKLTEDLKSHSSQESGIDMDTSSKSEADSDSRSESDSRPRSSYNTPIRSPTLSVSSLPPGVVADNGNEEKVMEHRTQLMVMSMQEDRSFRRLGNIQVNLVGSIADLRRDIIKDLPKKVKNKPFVFVKENLSQLDTIREMKTVVSNLYSSDCVLIRFLTEEDPNHFYCVCGAVAHFECSLCGQRSYCSPKCQSMDWPDHMIGCLNGKK